MSTPDRSWPGSRAPQQEAAPPGRSPRPAGPGLRLAGAAGLLAVAVAGAGAGWLLGRGGDAGGPAAAPVVSTSASSAQSAPSPSTSARSTDTPAALTGTAKIDAEGAAAELRKAGLRTAGDPVEAWSWTDANGRNILLTSKTVDKREGTAIRAATLHVYQAVGLGTRPRMLVTPLRDPGRTPCDLDFNLDFVPGSVHVTDADGDGVGEASVGWWSACRGDPGPERLKLAVLTGGTYFILRGSGLVASQQLPPGITVPAATFTPNVPRARWPRGTFDATVAEFHQLFR